MLRKNLGLILMLIVVASPHYYIMTFILPESSQDPFNAYGMLGNIFMILFPILASFVCKSGKQQGIYLMACLSIIAFGEYLSQFLNVVLTEFANYSDIHYYECRDIIAISVSLLKMVLAVITFFAFSKHGDDPSREDY